jgi:O-antigen ligase
MSLVLLGLMMIVPFVQPIHLQPIPSFHSEMAAASLGLAAAIALYSGAAAWSAFTIPRVALVPAILLAAIGAQWLAGRIAFPQVALLDALFLLWAALLACLGAALARDLGPGPLVSTMTRALVVGGLISAVVATIQFCRWPAPEWLVFADAVPATNLGQRNHAADYLWLAVVSTIGLRLRGEMPAWLTAAVLSALVLGAALTGSRGPIAYGVLLTILGAWWWRHEGTAAARSALVLSAATSAGFLAVSALLAVGGQFDLVGAGGSAVDRLTFGTLSGDPRLTLWRNAWSIFVDTPWLGCGAGNYPWRSFELASLTPPGQLALPAEHAHNLILQWLAEYGLIATLAVVAVLAWWLRDALRARLDAERWWLLGVLAVIGGHSLLEYPLWYGYFLSPFAVLLGAGDARTASVAMPRGRLIYALATVLAGLAMADLWRDEQRIEDSVYRAGSPQATAGLIAVAKDSLLAPLARHGVALAMIPREDLADGQAKLCDEAWHFRPRPDLIYKCAQLDGMLGQGPAANALRTQAQRAWPGESAQQAQRP